MFSKYTYIQILLGHEKMPNIHFQNMLHRLIDCEIITIISNKNKWNDLIRFNIDIDDAIVALKQNEICDKIISTLE